MAEHDPADIERRLNEGEWLGTVELGVLFGRDRTTIYRWARSGRVPHREDPISGELTLSPTHVRALLVEARKIRGPE